LASLLADYHHLFFAVVAVEFEQVSGGSGIEGKTEKENVEYN